MNNIKKVLLLAMCSTLCGLFAPAFSADDFSFDLDSAINETSSKNGTDTDKDSTAGSSARAIYPTVDAQSYLTTPPKTYMQSKVSLDSIIAKYKAKNYVGCIQEAQAKMTQDNPNPVAMYYMALSYTQIGDVKAALELYDAILKLQPSPTLTECAIRGRDCLIGGSSCPNVGVDGDEADAQVEEYKTNARLNYNSKSTEQTVELPKAQETVANKTSEQPAPNNDDIAQAIKTLQTAGIAVTLQPNSMPNMQKFNSEMAQMNMLLGNNNGNQNHSFDMLPYMMSQAQNNPSQYNPQMLQAMMMNYMMPSMDFNSSNNKN